MKITIVPVPSSLYPRMADGGERRAGSEGRRAAGKSLTGTPVLDCD